MQVGDKVRFVPSGFSSEPTQSPLPGKKDPPPREVTGTVIAVNREHRHYTVEAKVFGYTLRETFKF